MPKQFQLHPVGHCRGTIDKIDVTTSKKGNAMLVVSYSTDADFEFPLKDYIMLELTARPCVEKREAFAKAIGVQAGEQIDPKSIIGYEVPLYIEHEDDERGKTWPRVYYEGSLDLGNAVKPTKKPAPKPAQAPAAKEVTHDEIPF